LESGKVDRGSADWAWFTRRWRYTAFTLRRLAADRIGPVAAEIVATGVVTDLCWRDFTMALYASVQSDRRVDADLADAIAGLLMGDLEPLRQSLTESRKFLAEDIQGRAHSTVLGRGFVRLRDAYIGTSFHRAKQWSRVDRISRSMAESHFKETGEFSSRCSSSHFREVMSYIREHHAGDRHLPQKLSTLIELFEDFCDDCSPQEEDAEVDLVAVLPGADAAERFLLECVDSLAEEPRQFVKVKHRMSEPVEISVSGYCQRVGLEPAYFASVLREAMSSLRHCVTAKMEAAKEDVFAIRSSLARQT
jgi:hypothetical protein